MDFQISFNGKTEVFEKYKHMIEFIDQSLAQWNNFENKNVTITVKKIKGQLKTHEIHVEETIQTQDVFGQSQRPYKGQG